jgi:hypothetical protein
MRRLVTAAVLATLAVALTACQPPGGVPAGSSAAPSPAPVTGSGSPGPTQSPAPDPVACQPNDLDPRPYYSSGGGAMGSVGYEVVVRNARPTACRLHAYPVLYDSGVEVPQTMTESGQQSILVPPGRYAGFLVLLTNGYGGYGSSDPACQHPQRYENLAVGLADGKRFPLPGLRLAFQCGLPRVGSWGIVDPPSPQAR